MARVNVYSKEGRYVGWFEDDNSMPTFLIDWRTDDERRLKYTKAGN